MSTRVKIGGHEVELSHLDKVWFPQSGITKGDVLAYYDDMSSLILPLYKDHALTMLRCPDGIKGEQFMQKNVPDYFPEWIETYTVPKDDGQTKYALVNNKATLLYIANQGCISFHLSLSKVDKFKYPCYLIFDFDPSVPDLKLLKKVVKWTKELMDELGLPAFLQTTGSEGFHIYVPLKREVTNDESLAFAKECGRHLVKEHPHEITIEMKKDKRGDKVFLDYARNARGFNNIGPYSLRPIENAPLATPLHWDELNDKSLHPQSYNLKNIAKRLSTVEDPWKDLLKHPASLKSKFK